MQVHPEAQFYRNKALMNFNDLCLIYAHTTADGRYSLSSRDIDFDDDIQGENTGVFLYPSWISRNDAYAIGVGMHFIEVFLLKLSPQGPGRRHGDDFPGPVAGA